ncbi:MAG: hypothetical protein GXP47_02650, partial [Acidobacteria bacterium]|nr:hypothetical protein [Acidobacteriota bacterium]
TAAPEPWWARPALRWAWAAAMLLVLAGHAYLSLEDPAMPPSPAATARPAPGTELADDPVLACCPGLSWRVEPPAEASPNQRLLGELLKGDLS